MIEYHEVRDLHEACVAEVFRLGSGSSSLENDNFQGIELPDMPRKHSFITNKWQARD